MIARESVALRVRLEDSGGVSALVAGGAAGRRARDPQVRRLAHLHRHRVGRGDGGLHLEGRKVHHVEHARVHAHAFAVLHQAVRDLAGRGATAIKVSLNMESGPTPTDAELAAICDEAHRHDLPVTAHAQGSGQVERALGAGIDELAHTPWTRLSDEVIETAAARMRIVSTLDILSFGRDTPQIRAAIDNLRRFHAANGTVIYGTDLGNGSIPPGINTREVVLLRDAGLEPEEVLHAMVRAPMDLDAPADLIALSRSPLDDPTAFDDLQLVVRAGKVVFAR